VYVGTNLQDLIAVDATYGYELASMHVGAYVLNSAAVSDGVVYVSPYDGNSFAFALGAGVNSVPKRADAPMTATLVPDMSLKVTPALSPSEAKALSESEE
jgi:outer membrane protein assembly factor BamB